MRTGILFTMMVILVILGALPVSGIIGDADEDGVLDADDFCTYVPGSEENIGCPEPENTVLTDGNGVGRDVYYEGETLRISSSDDKHSFVQIEGVYSLADLTFLQNFTEVINTTEDGSSAYLWYTGGLDSGYYTARVFDSLGQTLDEAVVVV